MLTPTSDNLLARRFQKIIASWEDTPRCEIGTAAGNPCQRPAAWRTNFHGCAGGLTCTHHLRVWLRRYRRQFAEDGSGFCTVCGHTFNSIEDVYTAVEL